ncbi:MAG TPA: hypothetical protein VMB05_08000 [Solirubrobacteraceae bacterium]|nr:hypothetical protein [Solirubrobacteraceae bacterium]
MKRTGGSEAPPVKGLIVPQSAHFAAYQRRCARITEHGAYARVLYPKKISMTRGNTETVKAALTLNRSLPPERILQSTSATAAPAIVVSCVVDARLRSSTYTFAIDDRTWQEKSFLETDTAHWEWYVGPKIGGDQKLSLDVRPIVSVRRSNEPEEAARPEEASIETYAIDVKVQVPWTERPAELMSRLADTFKVAQGLVETLTGLITALVALAAVLGFKRAKAARAAGQAIES